MGDELKRWEVELSAASPVSVLGPASVPKTSDARDKLRAAGVASLIAFIVCFAVGALIGWAVRRAR